MVKIQSRLKVFSQIDDVKLMKMNPFTEKSNVIEGWVSCRTSYSNKEYIVVRRESYVTCVRGLSRDPNLKVNGLLYYPPPPSFSRLAPVHLSHGCISLNHITKHKRIAHQKTACYRGYFWYPRFDQNTERDSGKQKIS